MRLSAGSRREFRRELSLSLRLLRRPLEQIARLASQFATERLQGREAYCSRLVRLQYGKIRNRYADPVGEIGEGEPPIQQEVVELDANRHPIDSDGQGLFFVESSTGAEDFRNHQDDQ